MVSKWLRRTAIRRTLFAGIVVLLTATIGWLGQRVLAQDQQLTSQRIADDREIAADLVVAAFNQRLAAIERDLDAELTRDSLTPISRDPGAILVRLTGDAIDTSPPNALLYYPHLPPRNGTAKADTLVTKAQTALRSGNPETALDAYDQLERLGAVPIGDVVGGIPAPLFAALGRLTVRQKQGDAMGRRDAARALQESLRSGQWRISDATYQFLAAQLHTEPGVDDQLAYADAVAWLWDQRASATGLLPSGRASRVFASGPTVLVWRSSPDTLAAWVGNRRSLSEIWIPALRPVIEPRRARAAISTPDGIFIAGSIAAGDRAAVRLASSTLLPWTVQVTNRSDDAAARDRRRLLVAGIAVLFLVIAVGVWVIDRTVARELAIADLQSDFVSAVSHEFRTPLTTICQLSELLLRDRVGSDADRRLYYQLLHGEGHRLRRLVETLLNFGRLEAGRMDVRFADVDVGALARDTVAEFSGSRQAHDHRVELAVDDAPKAVRADREVLKTVVWNLLENAAKYSPDCDTIWLAVRREGGDVALSVRDRGVGIPPREQRQVFDKFVRGARARASGVGGVGVGLAMARGIVHAHGGDISVVSEPGAGSTFTVTLPLVDSSLLSESRTPEHTPDRVTAG